MTKIDEYVAINLNSTERKQIIKEYDSWCKNGCIDEGILREHARLLSVFLHGDNAQYGAPITTQMKELYIAVCRFYANMYLNKIRIIL